MLALGRIQDRIDRGEILRSVGFFAAAGSPRAPADEILEGGLADVHAEREESKLPFLANLFAAIVFSEVSRDEWDRLAPAAEDLTYRKICLIGPGGPRHSVYPPGALGPRRAR